MTRYIRSSGWIEDETFSPDPAQLAQLFVPEHDAVDTGLVWEDGAPILRAPNPVGFGRDNEWL